ncbi:MAG: ABC transporter permease [Trueperella sp.]|nr:ABC transporter permease [Trueperella sp.]
MEIPVKLLIITGVGLSLMLVMVLALQRWARIKLSLQPLVAALRAVLQLTFVAVVLQGVFTYPWTAVLMLAVMLTVASATSGKRISELPYGRRAAALGIVVSATITGTLIFALQMMDLTVSNVIAIGGIITGNAMSGATLTGRNFLSASKANAGEIEGWLALGAPSRVAFARIAQISSQEALIPNLDQTKNTGLVTLPGAFVGALIGGASPIEAARFQLIVLVGVMLVQTICTIIVTRVLSQASVIVTDADSAPTHRSAESAEESAPLTKS